MMLAYASLLPHGMLGAALVGMTAVATQGQDAMSGRQGGQELLRQPADEQRPVPRGRFAQAPQAPRGDGGGCPLGHLGQSFAPRVHGWHEDEPAEDEVMATTPHKHDKTREVSEGHQHAQRHLQRGHSEKSGRWESLLRLYTF
jgi:hypothetical protein